MKKFATVKVNSQGKLEPQTNPAPQPKPPMKRKFVPVSVPQGKIAPRSSIVSDGPRLVPGPSGKQLELMDTWFSIECIESPNNYAEEFYRITRNSRTKLAKSILERYSTCPSTADILSPPQDDVLSPPSTGEDLSVIEVSSLEHSILSGSTYMTVIGHILQYNDKDGTFSRTGTPDGGDVLIRITGVGINNIQPYIAYRADLTKAFKPYGMEFECYKIHSIVDVMTIGFSCKKDGIDDKLSAMLTEEIGMNHNDANRLIDKMTRCKLEQGNSETYTHMDWIETHTSTNKKDKNSITSYMKSNRCVFTDSDFEKWLPTDVYANLLLCSFYFLYSSMARILAPYASVIKIDAPSLYTSFSMTRLAQLRRVIETMPWIIVLPTVRSMFCIKAINVAQLDTIKKIFDENAERLDDMERDRKRNRPNADPPVESSSLTREMLSQLDETPVLKHPENAEWGDHLYYVVLVLEFLADPMRKHEGSDFFTGRMLNSELKDYVRKRCTPEDKPTKYCTQEMINDIETIPYISRKLRTLWNEDDLENSFPEMFSQMLLALQWLATESYLTITDNTYMPSSVLTNSWELEGTAVGCIEDINFLYRPDRISKDFLNVRIYLTKQWKKIKYCISTLANFHATKEASLPRYSLYDDISEIMSTKYKPRDKVFGYDPIELECEGVGFDSREKGKCVKYKKTINESGFVLPLRDWTHRIHEDGDLLLNYQQMQAIRKIIEPSNGISTVTGGPGSGKTEIPKGIKRIIPSAKLALFSPLGRLSCSHKRRMGESESISSTLSVFKGYQEDIRSSLKAKPVFNDIFKRPENRSGTNGMIDIPELDLDDEVAIEGNGYPFMDRQMDKKQELYPEKNKEMTTLCSTVHMGHTRIFLAQDTKFTSHMEKANYIFVDEAQAYDLYTMMHMVCMIIRKCPALMGVIFCGDRHQIGAISPGSAYLQLLSIPDIIPSTDLIKNNRVLENTDEQNALVYNVEMMVNPEVRNHPDNNLFEIGGKRGERIIDNLLWDSGTGGDTKHNMSIENAIDKDHAVNRIQYLYREKYIKNYTEFNVFTYRREFRDRINRSVHEGIKNAVLNAEPHVYKLKTSSRDVRINELNGHSQISVGAKVRFSKNMTAAIVPLTNACKEFISLCKKDGVLVTIDDTSALSEFAFGTDYVISDSVANGDMEWIVEIITIGERSVTIIRTKNNKCVVIGNDHVAPEDVFHGYCGTVHTQTGNECDYGALILDFEGDAVSMTSDQLLVGMSRARKHLCVIGINYRVMTHSIMNKLFTRELGAGRDPNRCGKLKDKYADNIEVSIDTIDTIQFIYTGLPVVRHSDFADLFSAQCAFTKRVLAFEKLYSNLHDKSLVKEFRGKLPRSIAQEFDAYVQEILDRKGNKRNSKYAAITENDSNLTEDEQMEAPPGIVTFDDEETVTTDEQAIINFEPEEHTSIPLSEITHNDDLCTMISDDEDDTSEPVTVDFDRVVNEPITIDFGEYEPESGMINFDEPEADSGMINFDEPEVDSGVINFDDDE